MDGSRTGGCQAHAHFARKFGMRAGHERSHFLVAHLDELHRLFGAIESAEKAVDTVAWISVNTRDTPLVEALEGEVGDCRHRSRSVVAGGTPGGNTTNYASYDPRGAG